MNWKTIYRHRFLLEKHPSRFFIFATRKLWNYLVQVFLVGFSSFLLSDYTSLNFFKNLILLKTFNREVWSNVINYAFNLRWMTLSCTHYRFWFMSIFYSVVFKYFRNFSIVRYDSTTIQLFSTGINFSFHFTLFEKRGEKPLQNLPSLTTLLCRFWE